MSVEELFRQTQNRRPPVKPLLRTGYIIPHRISVLLRARRIILTISELILVLPTPNKFLPVTESLSRTPRTILLRPLGPKHGMELPGSPFIPIHTILRQISVPMPAIRGILGTVPMRYVPIKLLQLSRALPLLLPLATP